MGSCLGGVSGGGGVVSAARTGAGGDDALTGVGGFRSTGGSGDIPTLTSTVSYKTIRKI